MNAAMIISPNKYNNQWIASFGCENGQTMDFRFDTRKEAAEMIKGMGFELMTKNAFNTEMFYRSFVATKNQSIYHNYALNG